ncbi:hypothetical protein PP515_gp77 [Gordonia phage Sidious]|uniref:Uncharacterized protein n=1 Tax=Gordonia phage Sidious TaxID=2591118 RepID=A0A515MIJ5_9CAUD|nr:hypothetical protein PP515_gp77 [Gordonia phage Sidious]QDM56424.1 hypothetical protein SEA_SIDIOUS_77 [Gordonia phage Sidious]
MHLPELPDEIQSEDVQRALESLGIRPDKNTETVIRADSIAVTYLRTDADGEILTGSSGSISKVATTIRVRWPKRASTKTPALDRQQRIDDALRELHAAETRLADAQRHLAEAQQ